MTQDKEWSCGICTFLNKPLFLSCEMCGQDRPSQRPSPPQRQLSMDPAEVQPEEEPRRRMDCAPRSVQRHISSARVDIGGGIMGTLIMTDNPDDYETPDGKKPEDEQDELEDSLPDLDHMRPRNSRDDVRRPRTLPQRRHTFETAPENFQRPSSSSTSRHSYVNTHHHMSNSFSRMNGSFSNNMEDSFSGSRRGIPSRPRHHQDIHIVGQSNGLPVISVGRQAQMQRQTSVNRLDGSQQSHFSGDSSSRGHQRPSLVTSGSARHFHNSSSRRISHNSGSDFLPSLEPPPVPDMDNPADVDPQSVFAHDQERSNNRRKTAQELRRDRSHMLENVGHSMRNVLNTPTTSTPLPYQAHPALMQDTEALDSPRTRKERKKMQRKKLKGAVKGLMASMRLASVAH